jgi:multiple antibiotic resistance protein
MLNAIGESFGALFPVVNPIAVIPIFLGMTAGRTHSERTRIAFKSALFVFLILLFFLFVGEPLLHHFGISLEALQIAGGIVVGLTGLRLVMGEIEVAEEHSGDLSFTPLAMPLLAGPGALGVEMALEARSDKSDVPAMGFVIGIVLIAVACYLCFLLGAWLVRFIGKAGIDAIRRIFGLLVMAIGVEMIVHGINEHEAFRALLG